MITNESLSRILWVIGAFLVGRFADAMPVWLFCGAFIAGTVAGDIVGYVLSRHR